jgi:hypothetical protein
MAFVNVSNSFGFVLVEMTTNLTGNLFLSLLLILFFLIVLSLALKIPVEYSAILILPVMFVLISYSSDFLAIGGSILIFLGIIFAKNFFIN